MAFLLADLLPTGSVPTFSGHETFALRGNWLKKAFDLLQSTPDLFFRQDAFVLLGVGKNMAQSIRFWGRACGIFDKTVTGREHIISQLGHDLLDDDGWDPYLVTPTARWLLHWQIVSRPEVSFTWFYVFNLLRGGDFSIPFLAQEIIDFVGRQGVRQPSETTMHRDIECLVNSYTAPETTTITEDTLACPLLSLGLMNVLPLQQRYRLSLGVRPNLALELVAVTIIEHLQKHNRQTISFSELAYAPRSPGRVFRLDEDTLLSYVTRLHEVTNSELYYSDQAGIRQVAWENPTNGGMKNRLLAQAFDREGRYVRHS